MICTLVSHCPVQRDALPKAGPRTLGGTESPRPTPAPGQLDIQRSRPCALCPNRPRTVCRGPGVTAVAHRRPLNHSQQPGRRPSQAEIRTGLPRVPAHRGQKQEPGDSTGQDTLLTAQPPEERAVVTSRSAAGPGSERLSHLPAVAQLESGVSRPHAQLRPDQTRSSPRLKAPRASSLPSGLGSVRPRCPVGANPFPSGRQGEKTGCASERSPPLSWGTRAPYSPLERLSPHGRTRLYDLAAPPTGGQAFSYPKRHEFSKRKSLLSCKHPRKPPRTTRHLGRGQSRGVDKFSKMQGEAEGLTLPCRHLLGLSPPGG